MRLDRYLALSAGLTRSQTRIPLRGGRVKCNGKVTKSASLNIGEDDVVCLDGERLYPPKHRYLMLNKPQDFICATEDGAHPTILDLLPDEYLLGNLGQLHPAGRLDIDSTGLVLITDDGQWSHRVTTPNNQSYKRYQVELAAAVENPQVMQQQFAEGILLHGEKKLTTPAKLAFTSPWLATVEISEGRYHQVKRMFAALDNRVVSLHRDRIGEIELDAALKPGEVRELSEAEIACFSHGNP